MQHQRASLSQTWIGMSLLLLLSWSVYAATTLTASVDKKQLAMGETLELRVTTLDMQTQSSPDFSALTADFTLLNITQHSQISVINGHSESQLSWVVALTPKRTGHLTIPAFQLDAARSQPITIQVTAVAAARETSTETPKLFFQASATPEQPYVGSQVIYTLQLFYQQNVQNARLVEPTAPDADLIPLGDDRHYRKTVGKTAYEVMERRYAIIPHKTGTLILGSPALSGHIVVGDNDPFSARFFAPTLEPVHIVGKPVTLQVKAIPADVPEQTWLPAGSVTLQESWSTPPSQWRTGEPVTRTVTITATGVAAEQLPDLPLPAHEHLQIYPDKPVLETQHEGDTLQATKIIKYALLPNQAGTITLPAIHLPWWNTQTKQTQTAELPSQTITILPATQATMEPPPAPQSTAIPATTTISSTALMADARLWMIVALCLFFAWIVTLWLWLKRKSHPVQPPIVAPIGIKPIANEREIRHTLKKACLAHQPQATQQALLQLGACIWPETPPQHLGDIEQRISHAELKQALRELDKQLYTPATQAWNGEQFWKYFQQGWTVPSTKQPATKTSLPELHP